jgi:GNAT superfamily N-acetyltransferase
MNNKITFSKHVHLPGNNKHITCFVFVNDREAGSVDLYRDGFIGNLNVKPKYRSQGIATRLFTYFINQFETNQHKVLKLHALPYQRNDITLGINLDALVKFYKKFGFKTVGVNGNNAVIMERERS